MARDTLAELHIDQVQGEHEYENNEQEMVEHCMSESTQSILSNLAIGEKKISFVMRPWSESSTIAGVVRSSARHDAFPRVKMEGIFTVGRWRPIRISMTLLNQQCNFL